MIHSIHIENFRKHADLTVNFTAGINAIRAQNEAGKTTLLESIAYALFGAQALKEPLDDVVTYGVPVGKLKVDLRLEVAGVDYTIKRGKSGAELTFAGQVVTGQTEVTKFVEKLLGASRDMASKLMLAKQKDLGGALAGGPTAAGQLIEDLAGLDLIDNLVTQISETLPSGNTAAAQASVDSARSRAEPGEEVDLTPLRHAVRDAVADVEREKAAHQKLMAQLATLDVAAANAALADQARLQRSADVRLIQTGSLHAALAVAPLVAPAEGAIAEMRGKVEAQKGIAAAAKLHAELQALDTSELWDDSLRSLIAAVADEEVALAAAVTAHAAAAESERAIISDHRDAKTAFTLKRQQLEGQLIKETSCALCQKDLTDVPEVVRINSTLTSRINNLQMARAADQDAEMAALENADKATAAAAKAVATSKSQLAQLQCVVRANDQIEKVYARAEAFITLDPSRVPSAWTWTGPTAEPQDFAGALAKLELQERQAIADGAARAQKQKQYDDLLDASAADAIEMAALEIAEANHTRASASALAGLAGLAADRLRVCEASQRTAQSALSIEQALQAQIADQVAKAKIELVAAELLLADMQANNALVKKLRAARPQITDKLWAIVLAAVTTYFSDVRGEYSAVTRADGKFKVNGNPASGLSGSAEDVLGLAIRFALTKTFLPSIDFLILDEVAAACDDQRETAMLGLLATAGFKQTILVTHSDLADAFSDNVITL